MVKLKAFRIQNFRSIVDTGWVAFSADGVTVLVGQNESGKSSVLEALHFALTTKVPTNDDVRIQAPLPEVRLRIEVKPPEVDGLVTDLKPFESAALKGYLRAHSGLIDIICGWNYAEVAGQRVLEGFCSIEDPGLTELLQREQAKMATPTGDADNPDDGTQPSDESDIDADDVAINIWRALPLGILFNEASGSLPNQVEIDGERKPTGRGAQAALNFLNIAEIDLPTLLSGDRRAIENTLNRANSKVSSDFNKFWSQTIGKTSKLSLKCEVDNYTDDDPTKAGKPHLVFWMCDGDTQLYPKQRSQGVRWFLSFYLQLKASEKSKQRRVFLLDEPGANLHSRAQGDVLKLINQLAADMTTVVYSTHSPQLVEYPKLFRVHAVQRDGDLDDSPTKIIDAHRLGTASSDTLSPVLSAMGADLSQHGVIRKTNNVLLEEMSAHYYLRSFWNLTEQVKDAHFIAATGVNKIATLANMFTGWGLDFIVVVDDDRQGREALKELKKEIYGDNDDLAAPKLVKISPFTGIENVFSKADFAKIILEDLKARIEGENSEYVKSKRLSKPVLAVNFFLRVCSREIVIESLSQETRDNIATVTGKISTRLE